mmetsp:Transcript_9589/g.13027  ORF Transcript_9589/g.13027 Transcript_9589/m.13027 type:complete len:103 (-) Transcript_9589:113-421(-)
MGREEAKEQSKTALKEKELAACAKKQARKDKEWEKGTDTRGTAKSAETAAKEAEAARRKAEAKAQELSEGGEAPRPSTSQTGQFKKCKFCSTKHDPKKGCPM